MKRLLLDTNHFSAFWRQDLRILDRMGSESDAEYGLSTPGLGEQWYMVFNSVQVERNRARMELLVLQFRLWDYDEVAAREYGLIRAELRRAGRPIPPIDLQIASIARAHQLILLSSDRHFAHIQDLKVEDWLLPE
jgi:tRNA(fMet)-specific endonuclease VapC